MEGEGEQEQQEMTPEEAEYIKSLVGTTPTPDEKQTVHSFLHNVAIADDTTKLGNLKEEEVGTPKLPQRTYLELALFCKEIANMEYFHDYFRKKAEILTSSSLSKEAKLISLAVVTRREVGDISRRRPTKNKGWFGNKNKEVET